MSTWPTAPIGDLCNLVNGRAFKPTDWSDKGVPIVRIQNLTDEEKPFNFYNGEVKAKFLVDSGDILLSWSGTPGTSFDCSLSGGGAGPSSINISSELRSMKGGSTETTSFTP